MGPTRTPKTSRQGEASSSNTAGPSKPTPRRHHPQKESSSTHVPGVQKIKSALRQTRRLLAKDKLAADVRVETERRLKTLEADLAQAESSKKERDMATRYHKVKFFERQKVVRKLNQTKKRIASADASSKPQLESALAELRVDLNYILVRPPYFLTLDLDQTSVGFTQHYPKTKKYISLFPPEIREDTTTSDTPISKINPNSEEVRSWIRGRMEAGEIELEPELHLDSRGQDRASNGTKWGESGRKAKKASVSKDAPAPEEPADAFFGDDESEDSE
ncbi:hypothetical protein DXG03_008339 [Asterophora parasitica]|uniref:rRNA-processing protein EFG1 n=1 Tax=Asterophora parasitica TaxID=117018 RepID=A0A9P7KA47_9AGAR|nr:hypothetical protein DXG03_008339 [Asterophora parasitica]